MVVCDGIGAYIVLAAEAQGDSVLLAVLEQVWRRFVNSDKWPTRAVLQ